MNTVNMHEAKTHLSKLVAKAANGELFIIARAGKPLVKVVAIDTPEPGPVKRIGFMDGQIKVPDDFDTMYQDKIIALFEGEDCD